MSADPPEPNSHSHRGWGVSKACEHSQALWWIWSDLRLEDKQALQAAVQHADQMLPVFAFDAHLDQFPRVEQPRLSFLWDGFKGIELGFQRTRHIGVALMLGNNP